METMIVAVLLFLAGGWLGQTWVLVPALLLFLGGCVEAWLEDCRAREAPAVRSPFFVRRRRLAARKLREDLHAARVELERNEAHG